MSDKLLKECKPTKFSSKSGKPFYTVRVINSKLQCDGLQLLCIGAGDDGRVLKVMKGDEVCYAMKVYVKHTDSDIQDRIAKDQAYREFKALKLIAPHPNFLSLYSEELDGCLVREATDFSYPYEAWAIRFSYVNDSVRIDRFWVYIGMVYAQNKPCVNLTTMNILIVHIVHQMLSALAHMRRLAIRHRDLDACNILIQVSSNAMNVYLIDFARADLPDFKGTNYTESPNLKLDTGNCVNEIEKRQIRRAYEVPSTVNPEKYILAAKEPSDFDVMHLVLENCIQESENLALLRKTYQEGYKTNRMKILLFLDMLFLTETDQSITHSIEFTKALESWTSDYVVNEIGYCFKCYDVFRGSDIFNLYRGMGSMYRDKIKEKNNIIDLYWNSLECTLHNIKTLFDRLILDLNIASKFIVPLDDENYLPNVVRICKQKRKQLRDIAKTSRDGMNESLLRCFEVEKMATWGLYSNLQWTP